jgi:hypothetical protein
METACAENRAPSTKDPKGAAFDVEEAVAAQAGRELYGQPSPELRKNKIVNACRSWHATCNS